MNSHVKWKRINQPAVYRQIYIKRRIKTLKSCIFTIWFYNMQLGKIFGIKSINRYHLVSFLFFNEDDNYAYIVVFDGQFSTDIHSFDIIVDLWRKNVDPKIQAEMYARLNTREREAINRRCVQLPARQIGFKIIFESTGSKSQSNDGRHRKQIKHGLANLLWLGRYFIILANMIGEV